jgi:hypothetical protein
MALKTATGWPHYSVSRCERVASRRNTLHIWRPSTLLTHVFALMIGVITDRRWCIPDLGLRLGSLSLLISASSATSFDCHFNVQIDPHLTLLESRVNKARQAGVGPRAGKMGAQAFGARQTKTQLLLVQAAPTSCHARLGSCQWQAFEPTLVRC